MNTKLYKYPRTYHCDWSENLQNDDRRHPDMSIFEGKNVIVTAKMDGENTTMYRNHYHARSLDSKHHPSRDMVKSIWGGIRYLIDDDMRICGENLYAIHSIKYDNLESYFQVFSIWYEDLCLSWNDTVEYCDKIKLQTVPILYKGIYDEILIKSLWTKNMKLNNDFVEGYVIRISDSFIHDFDNSQFFTHMAKFVRKNHVQTDQHWMKNWNKYGINKLKEKLNDNDIR